MNRKILIVDDNFYSTHLLESYFEPLYSTVLTAKDGIEAIGIIKRNPDINVVLMDVRLPKMNGVEVARRIKNVNKDVMIIAQTGLRLTDDELSGFDGYFQKPLNVKEIIHFVEKHARQLV